jgi:prepilin-type N-terminal cleavage/methylation domain-containing protein
MRKQKGFSLIELLIVVAIILIIAAIAIPNLLRSRMSANESAGAQTIRTLITNAITYSTSYPTVGYPTTITAIGGAANPCVPTSAGACLVDNVLGCAAQPCTRDAYRYSITGVGGSATTPNTDFVAFGTPTGPNAGLKDYCSTADGVVRFQAVTTPPTAAITLPTTCTAIPPL